MHSQAFAQTPQTPAKQSSPTQGFGIFLPIVFMFAIFYLLIIRPQQKQAKKHQEKLKSLKKGDQVITSGGIHGKIFGIADSVLTLEIADNLKIKVERSAIQTIKSE